MLYGMKLHECDNLDEIFTHVDEDEAKTVRHFNATKMLDFARQNQSVDRLNIALDEAQIEFIKRNRGIERPKVDRLVEPYLSSPIIVIEFEPDIHLVVDGHHRLVRLWEDGRTSVHAYYFEYDTWTPFLVEDVNKALETAAYDSGMSKEVI